MPIPITGNGQQQILSEISLDQRNSNLSRHSKTTNVDDGPSRTISFKFDTAMSFGYDSEPGFNSEATGVSFKQPSQQSMTGIALRLMLQLSDHELLELWHRCIDARPEMKSWFHKISESHISDHDRFHTGPLGKAEQLAIGDFTGDLASGVDPPTAEEMTHKSQEIRRNRTGSLEDKTQGLLMFGAPQFYCTEDEGKCEVEVIRVGEASGECSVHVTTHDASAKEGEQYEKVDRELRFEMGSKSVSLPIAIKSSTGWNNVLEFKCNLSDAKGAELRENQRGCRVKIIDKHVFPTGRCKDVDKVSPERLFVEYCKMNYSHRVVRRGSIKLLCVGAAKVLHMILIVYLQRYLVDEVLQGESLLVSGQTSLTLVVVGTLFCVPQLLESFLNYRSTRWQVRGASQSLLQCNLIRKYLNLTPNALASISGELITQTVKMGIEDVADAYLSALYLFENMVRVGFLAIYQSYTDYMLLVPFLMFPLLVFSFLMCREARTQRYYKKERNVEVEVLAHVHKAINERPLIVDYSRRSFMVDTFEKVVRTYNTAHAELEGVQTNNKEFSSVMASVIIGCYIFVGGASVVFDGLLVGIFLSNLRVLQALGEVWKSVYEHFLEINSAFFALQQLAGILHLPDENEQKMMLSRAHQSKGREQRKECRVALDKMLAEGRNCKGIIAIDMIPLCMEDIKLRQGNEEDPDVVSFSWPTFSVQQGRCVCITGRAGCGKATFLRLLAGVNIPLEGDVMVPPHLTVRHISLSPVLFKGTLMENLLYGLDKDSPLAKIDRVVSICKQLGLSHRTCSHITNETVNDWEKVCPGTEVRLMHIARGLVSDPEVLILQWPSRGLAFSLSNRVFQLLRVLIEERGIGRDPAGIHKRRPRSVIYSTSPSDEVGIAMADELFLLDKASVIALTPEDLNADWFKSLGHSEVE